MKMADALQDFSCDAIIPEDKTNQIMYKNAPLRIRRIIPLKDIIFLKDPTSDQKLNHDISSFFFIPFPTE
jgi:hypothetical protein